MRILMLNNEFPPLGGGTATVNDALLQRFARVPLGIEAEVLGELLQPLAQDRHAFGGNSQRLAGPQAGVNPDCRDLALLPDRNDDEVERHTAVDGRLALRLGH